MPPKVPSSSYVHLKLLRRWRTIKQRGDFFGWLQHTTIVCLFSIPIRHHDPPLSHVVSYFLKRLKPHFSVVVRRIIQRDSKRSFAGPNSWREPFSIKLQYSFFVFCFSSCSQQAPLAMLPGRPVLEILGIPTQGLLHSGEYHGTLTSLAGTTFGGPTDSYGRWPGRDHSSSEPVERVAQDVAELQWVILFSPCLASCPRCSGTLWNLKKGITMLIQRRLLW